MRSLEEVFHLRGTIDAVRPAGKCNMGVPGPRCDTGRTIARVVHSAGRDICDLKHLTCHQLSVRPLYSA